MVEYGADPYINNNMNETAITKALLNYYHCIFSKLKVNDNKIYKNDTETKKYQYINDELKNHSNKLLNESDNESDILKDSHSLNIKRLN